MNVVYMNCAYIYSFFGGRWQKEWGQRISTCLSNIIDYIWIAAVSVVFLSFIPVFMKKFKADLGCR